MYKYINLICSVFCLLFFPVAGRAQEYLFGRIYKKNSEDILPGVTLQNTSTKKYNKSDMGGNYRIAARTGDSIIFTSAGYRADTLVVGASGFSGAQDVFLAPNIVTLAGVEVDELNKYEADSAQRRLDYAFMLNRKHPVKLVNEKRQGDAPGLNFSPIGYFSKRQKEERKFKKRLLDEDKEEYIDIRFPRSRVALLTKLTGDSLQQFMLLYRPGYNFCRAIDSQDMLLYINDKVILFRKGKSKRKQ